MLGAATDINSLELRLALHAAASLGRAVLCGPASAGIHGVAQRRSSPETDASVGM